MSDSTYQSPLVQRYASAEMARLFSERHRIGTWRRLWVALAEAQRELGLNITQKQVDELRAHVDDIDFDRAREHEERLKHDVMAHIHTFGEKAPNARAIIHLGATSAYVTDNGDLIQYKEGMRLILCKLVGIVRQLTTFAQRTADLPCVGLTHLQPAQLTTVGKRACLWAQDFLTDVQEFDRRLTLLRFLGVKGATGTQASFLSLFHEDDKVMQLDTLVAKKMGFESVYRVTGQTYPRKQDALIAQTLAAIAISAHKFATDLRLLAARGELNEPLADEQVGSSAMPHKRNPVLAERICGLARFALSLAENPVYTAATQWLERSLDDSANRRLCMPELFLSIDAVCDLLLHVTGGLRVNEKIIEKNLNEELPFLALEPILMHAVAGGADRQATHERLRQHSLAASGEVNLGLPNDLLARIARDSVLGMNETQIKRLLDVKQFTGRAPQQVQDFILQEVNPILKAYAHLPPASSSVKI